MATDSRTTIPALRGWLKKYKNSVEKDEHLTNDDLAKHLWILEMQAKTELLKRLQKTGETTVIGNRTNRKMIGFRFYNRSLVFGVLKLPSTPESDELVADEFRFVADLKELIVHYLEPFEAVENQNSLPEALRGKPDCLFGNIRELCELHDRVVLKDLVAARSIFDMCHVLMQHRNQKPSVLQGLPEKSQPQYGHELLSPEANPTHREVPIASWNTRARPGYLFFFNGAVMFCKKRVSDPGTGSNSEPKSFEYIFCIPISTLEYTADSRDDLCTEKRRFEVWEEAKTDGYVIEIFDPMARTKWIKYLGKSDASQHQ
ncbi:hypothetical protein CAEBREN_02634 [Caenorhabditis brenneri]|uniref:DH domain-containing protein n=1 Tax=Caenorhabditis brenneri TaxID=135651 RepID=G0NJX4_CAEBE|nr:hypothetical protein CAEBREN_02634 [Caenorhabditis brenneri]